MYLLDYDPGADVLYVRHPGHPIRVSREAATDSELILNEDTGGYVVGLQLLGAAQLGAAGWAHHPDRKQVPPLLHATVARWYAEREPTPEPAAT